MQQLTLFDKPLSGRIVNVASVPQLSPFRYPGGKTWLVPYLRRWLSPQIRQAYHLRPYRAIQFIEPFAGGGISSLTVASEGLADHITMVEIDEDVAAVWQTILHAKHWEWLVEQITSFDLTAENVESYLARADLTLKERAFKTLLRNRVNRGGILAPGAGRMKTGEGGKGMLSRWYPETLKKRIQYIVKMQSCISFMQGDGLDILTKYACNPDVVFFIDPPYTAAGKKAGSRLYRYYDIDHHALFECASKLHGDFLMTYDDTEEIRSLAQKHGFDIQLVPMKNTHHAQMRELLIGPDLKWLQPIE